MESYYCPICGAVVPEVASVLHLRWHWGELIALDNMLCHVAPRYEAGLALRARIYDGRVIRASREIAARGEVCDVEGCGCDVGWCLDDSDGKLCHLHMMRL